MSTDQERPAPRRAATPEERGRAAEQTRERILRAAVEEFGAKGYAGARTAGIAARAGVNQQLISYHFGGKQGLLDELRRRWHEEQPVLLPPGSTFGESLVAYLDATLDRPDWARLVIWRALGDDPGDSSEAAGRQRAGLREAVDAIRRRQADGELTAAVQPEFIALISHVLTFAPVAMPQFVAGILDVEPCSEDYREWVGEQLTALLRPV
ncbi:TetR/AcrR family transcriptional regulator [Streptosporangium roseum]|uniref:Transcriptional regulator, TetR family n=1 Tax=Streptosporangium roseum (strain ATCC 12428 / DSM 43021 / JCM 3005 / KCTC 9067 / NCIMB 10171 / NRRL 2505 / NI 9100) TaxID=479432 RepID=D2BC87_STRRD|nr:TetR/AcrR family transcriptional regulator [Streptosporangium roseum]ACZ89916.1 putative transcriptional regulator, TetR family [Streptosporangium roseum DSM 43021]